MILDAGVWLASSDTDDRFFAPARSLIESTEADLTALDLTLYEIVNVAVRKWGEPRAGTRIAQLVLELAGSRLIRVDQGLAARTTEIATERGLTGYDAAYVAASERTRLTLVSTDVGDLVGPGLAIDPLQALALASP